MSAGRSWLALALVAGAALLGGCAPAAASGHIAAPTGPPHRTHPIVYVAEAAAPDLVLVAVGSGPQGGSGVQVLATTATGQNVRAVGPPAAAGQWPDSLFILDRQHFWLTTFSGAGGGETLYRTADGGHHWRSSQAPSHSLGAGSTAEVQFITAEDGWLADIQPTAPLEALYRTTDGGTTWDLIAQLNDPAQISSLPRLGRVTFEPGAPRGWLGGLSAPAPFGYQGPLDVSRDQGRSWQAAALPVRQGDLVGVPAIFPTMLLVPVARCAGGDTELLTYSSTDHGATWSLASAQPVAAGCQQVATAFPSPSAGWAATLSNGRVRVQRTTDHGAHWRQVPAPRIDTSYPPAIIAMDTRHAWLLVAGLEVNGSRIYATADGGRTWRRVDQSITSSY